MIPLTGASRRRQETRASVNYETLTYEGYGPSGVAIIVDTLTDNKNRTAANVRSAFTKGGGNVGTPGSVSYMFDKKGQIIIDKEECEMDPDELMMAALDAGAEDFSEEEDSYEVLTDPDDFSKVREALEAQKNPHDGGLCHHDPPDLGGAFRYSEIARPDSGSAGRR